MKRILLIICVATMLIGCNQQIDENGVNNTEESESTSVENSSLPKEKDGSTLLCKVDGEDWGYTKGSGLYTTSKKSGDEIAIFTFSKKLEKGSETIQVEFKVGTEEITRVLASFKKVDKKGVKKTAHYGMIQKKHNYTGSLIDKGTVDLTNPLEGSGTAQFVCAMQFSISGFPAKDEFVEITDLNFTDVGYSDLNKFNKKMKSLTGK